MTIEYKNILTKSLVLLILVLFIGLPINDLAGFILLIFSIPIIIFTKVINKYKYKYLIFLISAFILINLSIPSLKIQEGHNLVILNDKSDLFYKSNFPTEIYDYFKKQYLFYKTNSECDQNLERCWKNFDPQRIRDNSNPTNQFFAISSDWSIYEKKYSRIVNNINFSNLISARIGQINNLSYNYFWSKKYDLARANLPFFVMYEIPKNLIDSSICWEGNIFWENDNDKYYHKHNNTFSCQKILKQDVGKLIYGVSLGSSKNYKELNYLYGPDYIAENDELDLFLKKNKLKIKLKKSITLELYDKIKLLTKIIFIFLLFFLFFQLQKKLYLFSLIYSISFLFLLNYTNKNLLLGFDLFTGGNDGLLYFSYGSVLYNHILNNNFYEFFRGIESVFYFPSSLRYFWPLNHIFFGETFYGYLLIGHIYVILIFLIFQKLFGFKWSIFLTFLIYFTRIFEGYALSAYKYISHINAGDAEPLAIFFFLLSLIIFLNITSKGDQNKIITPFLFGFFIFLSISLRPNYLPTGFLFFLLLLFYYYFNNKSKKPIIYLFIGFLFIFLIPLHNYIYGGSYTLLSSGHHHNTHVPVHIYYHAFIDLINFNFQNSEYINKILRQMYRWIKPYEIHYLITFSIIIYSLIKNKSYAIKSISLLALSQHAVLLVFEPTNRYAYLAWILTIIITFEFTIKNINKYIILKK